MTGPEHYAEAERLLAYEWNGTEQETARLARAQVHATLALAAATVVGTYELGTAQHAAWRKAGVL